MQERRYNLLKHVESLHFPGTVTYTCRHCGEFFTTRARLNNHTTKYHHPRILPDVE
jgi:hypothetical protein